MHEYRAKVMPKQLREDARHVCVPTTDEKD